MPAFGANQQAAIFVSERGLTLRAGRQGGHTGFFVGKGEMLSAAIPAVRPQKRELGLAHEDGLRFLDALHLA